MKKDTTAKSSLPAPFDASRLFLSLPPQTQADSSHGDTQWDLPTRSREYYSPRTDLRSAAPIFTPKSSSPFLGERPEHRHYLEFFHVRRCERDCPGSGCLNAHVGDSLRRALTRTEAGEWSYSSTQCSESQCVRPGCQFAHGFEERMYHPEMYKTSYCVFSSSDVKGRNGCQGYGFHCPFAHSPTDLRLAAGKPAESGPMTESEVAPCDLRMYKIVPCPDVHCVKKPCKFYHNPFDRRRDPTVHSYLSQPCRNVYNSPSKHFSHPDRCRNGDDCKYSHTKFEAYYHPSFYKTQICAKMISQGNCKRGAECAFLHAQKQDNSQKTLLTQLVTANQKLTEENNALKKEFVSVKDEISSLKKKLTCPICHKSDKAVYLSCGHLLCQPCSANLSTCPNCSADCVPVCALRL